jgi:hypothetical protein
MRKVATRLAVVAAIVGAALAASAPAYAGIVWGG